MGQITSLFVHKVIAQVDDSLDKRAFLESVGVDPDAPVDPKVMVAATDYYQFFADLARADPNGLELSLRVGASMRCENYGAFGLAWKSAPNLRGSCERASRYARVLTSVATYEVREAEEGVYMHLHRDGDRAQLGLRLSNEATIASVAAISQEVSTSTFRALAIYFKHEVPGSAAAHEDHFGCPVHFGTDMDALLISRHTMQAPNRVGDPSMVKYFDTHLDEELSKFDDNATLERRELAERLLKETSYPLAEVAFLTGFSEQSAFNRAFKRWAGQTPRSFRIKA